MADINVERKRSGGPNFLPWLVGLLVLGLLIWGLSRLLGGGDEVEPVPATDSTTLTTDTMMPTATPVAPAAGAADSAGGDNVPEGAAGTP
jgi:hypothetical protein